MLETLGQSVSLLAQLDAQVLAIVWLSFKVSFGALLCGTAIGLPLGAWVAVADFQGRAAVTVVINGLMGLPSVVVGVFVYLVLSRSGPLGGLGILYSPPAMVAAQTILVVPLITALTRQTIEDAWRDYAVELRSMGFSRWQCMTTLLYDCRFSLVVALLAGLGRAMSEVGAVMIVGGNIDGYTRVMTTSIALETAKGDLPLSIALGIVLLSMVLAINAGAYSVRHWAMERFG